MCFVLFISQRIIIVDLDIFHGGRKVVEIFLHRLIMPISSRSSVSFYFIGVL